MRPRGWETRHTIISDDGQLEITLQIPGSDVVLTGHPDGICRHPDFTGGHWVTLECKSMGEQRAQETQHVGIDLTHPGYIVQISLYSQRLHQMGFTHNPEWGVFGLMDRDGRPVSPQRTSWTPQLVKKTLEKLSNIIELVDRGLIPDRPYAKDSTECRLCNYHDTCWGTPPDGPVDTPTWKPPMNKNADPETAQAVRTWSQIKPLMDQVRRVLQDSCENEGGADIIADGVIAGFFQPRNPPVYDPDKLARLVPADILQKCAAPSRPDKKAFWIRTARY